VISTVVIPTYNRQEQLAAALDALAVQFEPDIPFAVVVVDDGSEPAISIVRQDYPYPVKLVRLPENRGRAAARNAGIAVVETPLTVFIDDDMRVEPGYIRAWQEYVDPHGKTVGLGHVVFHPDVQRDALTRYLETRGIAKLSDDEQIPYRYFLTYNSAVPTHLLREVGGFDERLRAWGGEDLELALRLQRAGGVFVRVPDAKALHAHCRDLLRVWDISMQFARDSMPILFEKHPELIRELHADVLGPLITEHSLRRVIIRALTRRPLPDWLCSAITRWPKAPWPMRAFDYVIASAWRRGLDEAAQRGR